MTKKPKRWTLGDLLEIGRRLNALFPNEDDVRARSRRWARSVSAADRSGWLAMEWLLALETAGHLGATLDQVESIDPQSWAMLTKVTGTDPATAMHEALRVVNLLGLDLAPADHTSDHLPFETEWFEHDCVVTTYSAEGEPLEVRLTITPPGSYHERLDRVQRVRTPFGIDWSVG